MLVVPCIPLESFLLAEDSIKKENVKTFLQLCGIFSYEPSYQVMMLIWVSNHCWNAKIEHLNTSYTDQQQKQNTISTFCSWIRATIGMYKTISTDAKNALTWNTAISTILDTKIPSKIHVTTQNMVLVIWQKINIFGTKVIELCYFLSYQNKKLDHNITMWLYSKLH